MTSERIQRPIDRLLYECLAISQELGMRPLMERVFNKQFCRAQDGTPPPPQNYTAKEKDANQEVDHAPYGLCDTGCSCYFP